LIGYVDFVLDLPGFGTLHFLVCRHFDGRNLDHDLGDLSHLRSMRRHPSGGPFFRAFRETVFETEADRLVVIRNPDLVLEDTVVARLVAELDLLPDDEQWALAAAGGLGIHDRRYLSLYASAAPAIPDRCAPKPLIDILPDFYLVNISFAQTCLDRPWRACDAALECSLALEGYLEGRISLFLPGLTAGVDGHLLSRDISAAKAELENQFSDRFPGETLKTMQSEVTLQPLTGLSAPPTCPDLRSIIYETIHLHCRPLSLSIVTRTRFERPHLLRRLLTSISRARLDDMALEVVLSSDQDPAVAERHFNQLKDEFIHLNLRLRSNPAMGFSRVNNLIRGLETAQNDYVVVIDDDDYLDISAFEALRLALFAGQAPVIVTTSGVYAERWEAAADGGHVLAESVLTRTYPASGWRNMFSGVNALPVNAAIFPRQFLQRRLIGFQFEHDLSEDYALALLMLTAPDLPEIFESPCAFCNISLRGSENSVTMLDRRPWVRDIAGYLRDLTQNRSVAGPGCWDIQCVSQSPEGAVTERAIADLREALTRRETDLRILRKENERLRTELSMTRDLAQ
jgi:hypothetical protein